MKALLTVCAFFLLYACGNSGRVENRAGKKPDFLLVSEYPGVIDIVKLWLLHYKGPGKVEVLSVNDEKDALRYLKEAHEKYNNNRN